MKLSIRTKLLSSYLFILLIVAMLMGSIFLFGEQYLQAQQIALLNSKSQLASNQIRDYFSTLYQHQQSLASVYVLNRDNLEEFRIATEALINQDPSLQSISLIDPSGVEQFRVSLEGVASPSELGVEIPSSLFSDALLGNITLSKTFYEESDLSPTISIYTPVLDSNASTIAVIKSSHVLSIIPESLNNLDLGAGGVAYIVDYDQQVVAHPNMDKLANVTLVNRPILEKLISSGYASLEGPDHFYTNESGVEVVSSSSLIPHLEWMVVTEQPTSVAFGPLILARNLLIGVFVVVLVLLLILSILLSEALTRPIRLLKSQAMRIRDDKPLGSSNIKTGDELEDLSNTFNTMAEQLAERQRSLTETNQSLQAERNRQHVLLQALSDGVLATNNKGTILLFNRAAEHITGMSHESVVGRNINAALQFYRGDDSVIDFDTLLDQSSVIKRRLREDGVEIHTDGGLKTLSVTISSIKLDDEDMNGWMMTFTDMTKEKEFEAMKLDFVSMAAHELRTPLTALRGYLSMLIEESTTKFTREEKKYLDRSYISANQLNSLVENLLNLSRVERGALKLEVSPLPINKLIEETIANLSHIAQEKDIVLQFTPKEPSPLALVDRFRIIEVLTNLINNGISYTQPGGWVKISTAVKDQEVEVSVSDNGQGIPAASIPRLFTKFYRVHNVLAMGSKGTGLGLYISKSIITAHHGKIWVDSVESKGSTFTFTLPLEPKLKNKKKATK